MNGASSAQMTATRTRRFGIALGANLTLMVVQIVASVMFASLALLADATHQFADNVGLAVALVANLLANIPASDRRTFGFRRADLFGALISSAVLLATSVWLVIEAVSRFGEDRATNGIGLALVAVLAIAINLISAWAIHSVGGKNMNSRAAVLHLMSDAGASAGVLIAGLGIWLLDWHWLDPLASLLITALVIYAGWGLIKESTHLLLEGVPKGLSVSEIKSAMAGIDGVGDVHHMHVWAIDSETPALSAHVKLDDAISDLHSSQVLSAELEDLLATRFGIAHCTLAMECHKC